eukprot:Rhum_TRINITY_DN14855_c6_g1::Rhum_TRINITY_DN14855_c6_g1_i1::g.122571::m.122571
MPMTTNASVGTMASQQRDGPEKSEMLLSHGRGSTYAQEKQQPPMCSTPKSIASRTPVRSVNLVKTNSTATLKSPLPPAIRVPHNMPELAGFHHLLCARHVRKIARRDHSQRRTVVIHGDLSLYVLRSSRVRRQFKVKEIKEVYRQETGEPGTPRDMYVMVSSSEPSLIIEQPPEFGNDNHDPDEMLRIINACRAHDGHPELELITVPESEGLRGLRRRGHFEKTALYRTPDKKLQEQQFADGEMRAVVPAALRVGLTPSTVELPVLKLSQVPAEHRHQLRGIFADPQLSVYFVASAAKVGQGITHALPKANRLVVVTLQQDEDRSYRSALWQVKPVGGGVEVNRCVQLERIHGVFTHTKHVGVDVSRQFYLLFEMSNPGVLHEFKRVIRELTGISATDMPNLKSIRRELERLAATPDKKAKNKPSWVDAGRLRLPPKSGEGDATGKRMSEVELPSMSTSTHSPSANPNVNIKRRFSVRGTASSLRLPEGSSVSIPSPMSYTTEKQALSVAPPERKSSQYHMLSTGDGSASAMYPRRMSVTSQLSVVQPPVSPLQPPQSPHDRRSGGPQYATPGSASASSPLSPKAGMRPAPGGSGASKPSSGGGGGGGGGGPGGAGMGILSELPFRRDNIPNYVPEDLVNTLGGSDSDDDEDSSDDMVNAQFDIDSSSESMMCDGDDSADSSDDGSMHDDECDEDEDEDDEHILLPPSTKGSIAAIAASAAHASPRTERTSSAASSACASTAPSNNAAAKGAGGSQGAAGAAASGGGLMPGGEADGSANLRLGMQLSHISLPPADCSPSPSRGGPGAGGGGGGAGYALGVAPSSAGSPVMYGPPKALFKVTADEARQCLVKFYGLRNKLYARRLQQVDKLMALNQGKEATLLRNLQIKYPDYDFFAALENKPERMPFSPRVAGSRLSFGNVTPRTPFSGVAAAAEDCLQQTPVARQQQPMLLAGGSTADATGTSFGDSPAPESEAVLLEQVRTLKREFSEVMSRLVGISSDDPALAAAGDGEPAATAAVVSRTPPSAAAAKDAGGGDGKEAAAAGAGGGVAAGGAAAGGAATGAGGLQPVADAAVSAESGAPVMLGPSSSALSASSLQLSFSAAVDKRTSSATSAAAAVAAAAAAAADGSEEPPRIIVEKADGTGAAGGSGELQEQQNQVIELEFEMKRLQKQIDQLTEENNKLALKTVEAEAKEREWAEEQEKKRDTRSCAVQSEESPTPGSGGGGAAGGSSAPVSSAAAAAAASVAASGPAGSGPASSIKFSAAHGQPLPARRPSNDTMPAISISSPLIPVAGDPNSHEGADPNQSYDAGKRAYATSTPRTSVMTSHPSVGSEGMKTSTPRAAARSSLVFQSQRTQDSPTTMPVAHTPPVSAIYVQQSPSKLASTSVPTKVDPNRVEGIREALLHLIASHDSDTTEGSDSADAVAEWSRRHTPHGPPSVAPHSAPSHAHRPTHSPSTADDDTSLASPTVTGSGPGTRTSSFRRGGKGGGAPSTPARAERARADGGVSSTSTSSRSIGDSRRPSSSYDSDVFAPSGGGGGGERRRRKESGGRYRGSDAEPEVRSEAVPEEPSDNDDDDDGYGQNAVPEEPSCAETSDVAEEPSTVSSRHSHQHPAAAGWQQQQQQQQRQRRRHVDASLPLASPRTPLGGTPLFKEATRGSPSDAVFAAASVRGYHGAGTASASREREREPVTPQPQWSAGKRSMGWSAMDSQHTRDPLLPIGGSSGRGKGFWY